MSASSCRRTCTARPPTSSVSCRSSRTCASSRARTSSPRPSRIPRSATSTARTFAWSSAAYEGARTSRSRPTTSESSATCVPSPSARASSRDRFELQMLYGVRPALQRSVAAAGYKVLVATPFGPDWYPYLMRRLAERPANLLFFLRNLASPMSTLPEPRGCRGRRWRRRRDEHRLPPRRGRGRRLPARARRALVGIDEPGGGRSANAVLGSAEHRDRTPSRRGLHALRRAAGLGDRLPPGRIPVPARPARGRPACSSGASRCRTSSASRVAWSRSPRPEDSRLSRDWTACSGRRSARWTGTRAPRRSPRATRRGLARTVRTW